MPRAGRSGSSRPVAPARSPMTAKPPTQSATRSYQTSAAPAPARPMSSGPTHSATPSSSASRPTAAPTSAAPQSHVPAVQQSHPPAPMAPQSGGGMGMMGQIATNVGTIAAGSVIGHGVSHMLFGGRGGGDAQPQAQAQAAPAQASPSQYQETNEQDPCHWPAQDFNSCLRSASGDISQCQGLFDALQQCRRPGAYQRDF